MTLRGAWLTSSRAVWVARSVFSSWEHPKQGRMPRVRLLSIASNHSQAISPRLSESRRRWRERFVSFEIAYSNLKLVHGQTKIEPRVEDDADYFTLCAHPGRPSAPEPDDDSTTITGRTMTMRYVLALVALAFMAGIATGASAATPKKFYWSEEKAEARALAVVRIPYCWTDPDEPRCAEGAYRPNGQPRVGFWGLNEVTCTGADEQGETFTYARFKCRFVAGVRTQDYATGRLLLYPAGAKKLRWKLVSLS